MTAQGNALGIRNPTMQKQAESLPQFVLQAYSLRIFQMKPFTQGGGEYALP